MILIKKNITAQGQQITLETFLEKYYSVTIINSKQKVLFLKDMSQSYIVDELQKKLVVFPGSVEQLAQIKNLLGEVWLDEAYLAPSTFKERSYFIANNFISASAKITGKVAVCVDDRLSITVNYAQNRHDSKVQLFDLPLAENEIISLIETVMEINGQKIDSKMELLSIEETIIPEAYKDFINYAISAKAA